jgi:hypothetical protein
MERKDRHREQNKENGRRDKRKTKEDRIRRKNEGNRKHTKK